MEEVSLDVCVYLQAFLRYCTSKQFCLFSFPIKFDTNNTADSSKMSTQKKKGNFSQYHSAQKWETMDPEMVGETCW